MISSFVRHVSWPGFILGVGTVLIINRWGRGAAVKLVSTGMGVRDESKAVFDAARKEVERVRSEAAEQHAQTQAGKRTIAQIKAEIAALQREVEGLEKEPAAAHKHSSVS